MILTPKNWKSFQHYKDRAPAWIKLHKGLLDDFEFSCLPVASKALAPMLWLIASEYEDGKIEANIDKLAFRLRMTRGDLADALSPLVEKGFFDASEPLAECKQDACLEKEEEREIEKRKISRSVASATRPSEDLKFEEFWKSFPRRDGPNPRKPAEQKFAALVKTGVDPDVMIQAAKQLAADEAKRGNIGTRFIPQAVTWLNQQRWADHAASAFAADDGMIEVLDQIALEAWDSYGKATNGKTYPRNRKGGWRFPSKYPPGYESSIIADVQKLITGAS
jgi:hypothetical protein